MTGQRAVPSLPHHPEASSGKQVPLWGRASFAATHMVVSWLLALVGIAGLYRFGRFFGTIEWFINYKRRRRFARAYARVLGHAPLGPERRKACREFFMRSRCDKLLYLIFDRISRVKAQQLFTITNQAVLEEAIGRGCGVYLAMSHHGAHHLAAMFLTLAGYRVALVRDRNESGVRRWVQERFGHRNCGLEEMRVVFADAYPREVYRCFQEGYVLGSAMDVNRVRNANQKVEQVQMFGDTRHFPSGPMRVALRCKAPVLQAFVVSEPGFRYRFDIVAKLVDPEEDFQEDAAVAKAMGAYASNVERYLRETPALLSRV